MSFRCAGIRIHERVGGGGGGGGGVGSIMGGWGGDGSIMGGGGWLHHVEGGLRNSPQEITMVLLQKKKNLVS